MTELLFYDDAYKKEFDATVTAVEADEKGARVGVGPHGLLSRRRRAAQATRAGSTQAATPTRSAR